MRLWSGSRVTLTADDILQIEGWYQAAAYEGMTNTGDSATNRKLKALLKKLGLDPHFLDQYDFDHTPPTPAPPAA